MQYKPDWPQVRRRFEALWNREVLDRPCISVIAPKEGQRPQVLQDYGSVGRLTYRHLGEPERVLQAAEAAVEPVFFGGEAIPQVFLNYGASGHCAYFGSDHIVGENTVWYTPCIADWETASLAFDPDSPMYQWQLQAADYLGQEARGRFFVSTLDNAGSLDALAHMRGNEQLLLDLLLNETHVFGALDALIAAWARVNEDIYQRTAECNDGGSTIGWLSLWSPGRMSQLQADISVMLSNELFKKYLVYELQESLKHLERSLYHFDGQDQLRHLDDLLALPALDMIQWTTVVNQPSYLEFLPELRRIQRAGKGLLLNQVAIGDVDTLLRELAPEGLFIVTQADSQAEAEALLKRAERKS